MHLSQDTSRARVNVLVETERAHLVEVLETLAEADWDTPSLCVGWSVKHVVVHVLMPYELSLPRFLARMVRKRFRFDDVANTWAIRDRRSSKELIQALRRTADRKFNVPGAPAEAPLSHLVVHSEDIYRPLGVSRVLEADSLNTTLAQLASPRARAAWVPGLVDGLTLRTIDTGWTFGTGAEVSATAASLLTTISGRTAALADLTGEGAGLLSERVRRHNKR